VVAEHISRVVRQSENPAGRPRLSVTVLANRAPYGDARRDGRIRVRFAIKVDVIPRQRSRFLGAYTRLHAQHDVSAETVPAQITSDRNQRARLSDC